MLKPAPSTYSSEVDAVVLDPGEVFDWPTTHRPSVVAEVDGLAGPTSPKPGMAAP